MVAVPAKIEPDDLVHLRDDVGAAAEAAPNRSIRKASMSVSEADPSTTSSARRLPQPGACVMPASLQPADHVEALDLRHRSDDPPQIRRVARRALRHGHAPVARQHGNRRRGLETVALDLEDPVERQVVEAVGGTASRNASRGASS